MVARMTEYASGETFKEYMNAIIDVVKDTRCTKVLADTREQPPLDDEDQKWSATTWSQKAESAGVTRVATVAPESVLAEMTIESVEEMSQGDDIERAYHDDYDDAVEWLQSGRSQTISVS